MSGSKKLLLFLASEKGYTALVRLISGRYRQSIGAVVTFRETGVAKCWKQSIENECNLYRIPCYNWREIRESLEYIIKENEITGAVAISWRYILPLSINEYLEDPLIVFHDSLLPQYRGFAPTPTAIMCGETELGVTALFAGNEIDNGEIILQKRVHIPDSMYIQDVIQKLAYLYGDMMEVIISQMKEGIIQSVPQNEENATYSIWRNEEDCHIDWNKSAKEIYNFVRAVGYPYPGAFSWLDNKKIRILRTEILPFDLNFCIRDAGKIWRILNDEPEVICGVGLLKIKSALDENGQMVQFNCVRSRLK